jgi:hypothetical protein
MSYAEFSGSTNPVGDHPNPGGDVPPWLDPMLLQFGLGYGNQYTRFR